MEIAAIILILVPIMTYLGYPALVIVAGRIVPARPAPPAATTRPALTILICAHNEAARIGAKLDSVLAACAAWPGAVEIIVGDDGSTDATATIVAGFADRGVRLLRAPRGGKAKTLDRIVALATGEILVMTDADPLFDPQTLPALIAPFADPRVGAVAGRVETIRAGGRAGGLFAAADALFRRYESAIRTAEDRLFGCISADGGLYAIRAALVPPVPGDVTDDFFISTAVVAAGRRIAFAGDARVHEYSIAGDRQQWRRRVRITVRGLTGLWRRRALMNPARTGFYAVALVLHKLARRLAPLALPPLWLLSGLLAARGQWLWALPFAALSGAVPLWLAGRLWPSRLPGPMRIGYGAILHLAGLAAGAMLFCAGRRYAQWTPQKDAEA